MSATRRKSTTKDVQLTPGLCRPQVVKHCLCSMNQKQLRDLRQVRSREYLGALVRLGSRAFQLHPSAAALGRIALG